MKLAILGTRGIPNTYGGIEEFAEHLSIGLALLGHEVTVYKGSDHPFSGETYRGVRLSTHLNPEKYIGPVGQFFYDLQCILDTRKHHFDVILQVGYTSSSIWGWLLPYKRSIIVSNMDGFEWKRAKWNKLVKLFLKYAEKLAVKTSHYLVADSLAIKKYIKGKYQTESVYIPYGAYYINQPPNVAILDDFGIAPFEYNLMVARLEPENNIEMIINGTIEANDKKTNLLLPEVPILNLENIYTKNMQIIP